MKLRLSMMALIAACAVASQAQWLYAPAASDSILTPASGNTDDTTFTPGGAAAFDLVGFSVFGAAVTPSNFRVNNNGFVWFGGATLPYPGSSWVNGAMPFVSSSPMIAPIWDDHYLTGTGTGVSSKSVRVAKPSTGVYVVTWQGEEAFLNTSPDLNFQVIMYGDGQNQRPTGTIIFCYNTMTTGTYAYDSTVGLNKGDGSTAIGIPSYGLGLGNPTKVAGLAMSCHSFVPNGQGGYTYYPGAVPEPASMAVLGLGALALIRRRRAAK